MVTTSDQTPDFLNPSLNEIAVGRQAFISDSIHALGFLGVVWQDVNSNIDKITIILFFVIFLFYML